jgi:hypothetical protein
MSISRAAYDQPVKKEGIIFYRLIGAHFRDNQHNQIQRAMSLPGADFDSNCFLYSFRAGDSRR